MSRRLSGRVVFRQAGPPRGIGGLDLEVRVHHALRPDAHPVALTTDPDGSFSLDLDLPPGPADLAFTIPEQPGHPRTRISIDDDDTLGDVAIGFWPYATTTATPRAAPVDGKLPQVYTKGYMHTLEKAFARALPAQGMLLAEHELDRGRPHADQIQRHMPKTLTLREEEASPGKTRSDAWLADQVMNGFDIALLPGPDSSDPDRLRAVIDWGEMPAKGDFDLNDVDVVLADEGGTLAATEITVRTRCPGDDGRWKSDETRTIRRGETDWEAAKRIVRCQLLLHGALDGHITWSHFQTEQYAAAVFRNLRNNPIRTVLAPHLQEIVAQDNDGDKFAWGPEGILVKQSALTVDAMHARMMRNTACRDWKTFSPRKALHGTHRYAKASQLYWDVLTQYLTTFVDEHRSVIDKNWHEIRRFSEDLVLHSLPWMPAPQDPRVVSDAGETDDPSVPRVRVGGALRACRPVTSTDSPAPGEVDALVQLCRVVIHTATFNHSWTHDGQYDAGGELAYATFGTRGGSFGREDDPAILPDPKLNVEALSTNAVGIHANYGYILADEEADVPTALQDALRARREAFAALGVDVDTIRSRINI